jgi:DNA polymerase sigma
VRSSQKIPLMEKMDPFYTPEEEARALEQASANNRTRDLLRSRRSSESRPVDIPIAKDSTDYIGVGGDSTVSNALAGASEGKVPWMPRNGYPPYRNFYLRLHQEILDFVRWVSLTDAEQTTRQTFINRLNGVCRSLWSRSKVVPFGSFLTTLSLPSSDVDISVVNIPPERCDDNATSEVVSLRKLANALLEQQQVSFVELRETAKIPILRVRDIHPPFCEFDISINTSAESPQATSRFVIDNGIEPYKGVFRPLVMILKCFLNQRNLADTFTGGVGSYLLSCLVLGFLQHHQISTSDRMRELTSLGHLLFDFFNFYSREFRVDREGLSVRRNGSKFLKSSRQFEQNRMGVGKRVLSATDALCIESPLEPHLDIGNKVFQWKIVRSAFMQARQYLIDEIQNFDPEDSKKSILAPALVNPIHEMFIRFHEEDELIAPPSCPLSGAADLSFETRSPPAPPSPYSDEVHVLSEDESDGRQMKYRREEPRRRSDHNPYHRREEPARRNFYQQDNHRRSHDNRFYTKRHRHQY